MSVAPLEPGRGGVTLSVLGGAPHAQQFSRANGFSNEFRGWGCEDDDFANRTKHVGYKIRRSPREKARYFALPHEEQPMNKDRFIKLLNGFKRYDSEGLNTVKFHIVDIVQTALFTSKENWN